MSELVIIRGLPGSGKSTYAKTHFPRHKHLEADMYFSRSGEYKFDFNKLNVAHRWCQESCIRALRGNIDVVVTNTFIQDWEFDHYLDMAQEFEVPVRVIELRTQFQNIHGVPEVKMAIMKGRWHDWETIVFPQFKSAHVQVEYEVVE